MTLTPAPVYLWACPQCKNCIMTRRDLHINDRPICVACNFEMSPVEKVPTARSQPSGAREFLAQQPHCIGYPDCDADLEGYAHSDKCPLSKQKALTMVELLELFAAQQIASLQEALKLCDYVLPQLSEQLGELNERGILGISGLLSGVKELQSRLAALKVWKEQQ